MCPPSSSPPPPPLPQGSVLGPVLFTFYAQPLSTIIDTHGCDYHKYADDTELPKNTSPTQFLAAQTGIETCIDDLLSWMNRSVWKEQNDTVSSVHTWQLPKQNNGGKKIPFKHH